jgi:hypothetical protein
MEDYQKSFHFEQCEMYFMGKNMFLDYFPEIKVGLSNHQSVCLHVCVSVTNNF